MHCSRRAEETMLVKDAESETLLNEGGEMALSLPSVHNLGFEEKKESVKRLLPSKAETVKKVN